MNYLTNYYRNLSEKLQEKVNLLESNLRSLNEDPIAAGPVLPSGPNMSASSGEEEQSSTVPGLQNFLSAWGTSNSTYDYNRDGVVDGADLGIFLSRYLDTVGPMQSMRSTSSPAEPAGAEGIAAQSTKGGKTTVKAKDQPSVQSRPISDLNYGPGIFSTKSGKTVTADKPESIPTAKTKKTVVAYPQAGADTKTVTGYDLTPGTPVGKVTGKETGKGMGDSKPFQPTTKGLQKTQQKVTAPANFAPIPGMAMGSPKNTGKVSNEVEMGLPGKMGTSETPAAKRTTTPTTKPGTNSTAAFFDFNNDGYVDANDMGDFLANWGSNNSTYDYNQDGVVNADDMGVMLANWGAVGGDGSGGDGSTPPDDSGDDTTTQGPSQPPSQPPSQRPNYGSIVHSWTSTGAAVDPEYFYSIRRLKKMTN